MRFQPKRCLVALCGFMLFLIICLIKVDILRDAQEMVLPIRRFVLGADDSTPAYPKSESVWDTSATSDRILSQIKYIPDGLTGEDPIKNIFIDGGMGEFGAKLGEAEFYRQNCSVKNCFLSDKYSASQDADAVLFRQYVDIRDLLKRRNPGQILIYYALESPHSLQTFSLIPPVFNWTATYRRDSTIVTPYAKWVPFDPPVKSPSIDRNFADGKTKQVAWFVSNCGANNNRLEYARELSKYIDVDIIGTCGDDVCPRQKQDCWEKLNEDYKFYLAFENSNCRDYITEKFFNNGLGYDVVPIVMGAHPDDYRQVAPPHSYISVEDFKDPKSLAKYLHKLDNNNRLYNEYLFWKGTGRFINTKFWCRLCALLNDKNKPRKVVSDMEEWMNGKGICQTQPWTPKRKF